jgi:hypothetical protein
MKLRADYFVIGFHHDFVGIADAKRDGRSVTNDVERVVGKDPADGPDLAPGVRLLLR